MTITYLDGKDGKNAAIAADRSMSSTTTGDNDMNATETRRGRKSEGKTAKLVCLITGSTRTAGSGYLSTLS